MTDCSETAFGAAVRVNDTVLSIQFIQLLLEYNGKPNLQNINNGDTSLHTAAATQNFKAVYYLLRIFAVNNLDMQNNDEGKSPLVSWMCADKTKQAVHAPRIERSLTQRFFTAVLGSNDDNRDVKRTLYAFLLYGVDVKKAFGDIQHLLEKSLVDKLYHFVSQAEEYIHYLQNKGYSREVIAGFVLGSRQEEEAFMNEASELNNACRYYGITIPVEIKDLILALHTPDFFKLKPKKLSLQHSEEVSQASTTLRM